MLLCILYVISEICHLNIHLIEIYYQLFCEQYMIYWERQITASFINHDNLFRPKEGRYEDIVDKLRIHYWSCNTCSATYLKRWIFINQHHVLSLIYNAMRCSPDTPQVSLNLCRKYLYFKLQDFGILTEFLNLCYLSEIKISEENVR